ncbi:MAG: bifunctional folylpolyglutamate synthase/dihydrofolate synthase [Pelagibacteraceae bacterium]|nr:bifunctional folylpolyglutamate synthase/dihydrofolate synthase [Pelagibacteraceae bacterium]PPR52156.1 MAG: Folylpolyglutamate synthase [Alphaproteobacteria bacterium MarineAlpha5_Bin10]|tara:strand:- start:3284 stop:4573 length:1290 start_codon:yes stop_codon:yes gene_type:complete
MKKLDVLIKTLQKLHPKYIDLSLVRINRLLYDLGNPHLNLPPCIHIAGTNGKGSILSFIKNIMISSNYKVHAYTSPHLENINERFFVSNKIISNKKLYETLKYVRKVNRNRSITFFEITTAAAFLLFSKNPADILILETGLGGRLDATNVIKESIISIITPIGLDHQEYLGHKINKITKEKLGIIKPSSKIICSKQNINVKNNIVKFAKINGNEIISYGTDWKVSKINKKSFNLKYKDHTSRYPIPSLIGNHQIYNSSTAIVTINTLKKMGYKLNKINILDGLKKTTWPGRLEKVRHKNPKIYLDGAHNIEGAKTLRKHIRSSGVKTWVILGMLKTKDIKGYLKIINSGIAGISAISIPYEKNSLSALEIKLICDELNIMCIPEKNVLAAIKNIVKKQSAEEILITGSLYLIGRERKKILRNYRINPAI